jgi:hypothetical protein
MNSPYERRMSAGRLTIAFSAAFLAATSFVAPAAAQTIDGTLMEVESDRPISLGLIIMMTADGDSITSSVTNSDGRFTVESETPGEFVLIASAFGFKETRAGIFELGEGGSMDVEFRVGADAMPIEGILVELQRPAIQHQLVRNGYVRRLQRGTGLFITPYDIEQSSAMRTPDLFRGIPGIAVRTVGGGLFSHTGESIQFTSAQGYCTPTLFLDGARMSPQVVAGQSIESLLPLPTVDAIEIYRRPGEVPIEYAVTSVQPGTEIGTCGVLVVWTKSR